MFEYSVYGITNGITNCYATVQKWFYVSRLGIRNSCNGDWIDIIHALPTYKYVNMLTYNDVFYKILQELFIP